MRIFGTHVHNITLPQALRKAEGFLYGDRQHYIVTPNPEIVLRARGDWKYRSILNGASLSIPDGVGLILASKILYGGRNSIKKRISGVDFMLNFLRYLYQNYNSLPKILLLGGRGGSARISADKLNKKFPHLNFYAMENIHNKHIGFVINDLIRPDLVFVGLGAPKQEFWIHKNLQKFPSVKLAMSVGGSFDFISGRVIRAPRPLRNLGMEWLWRLAFQPWRINRIFKAAVLFPALILRERLAA